MSSPPRVQSDDASPGQQLGDPNPPTVAAFSPSHLGHHSTSPSLAKQRATILVHQKSPLLVATPPQITRALAYSYPFIIPLDKLAALLSWTTGDPWESFLLVAAFWAVTLYGDIVLRWAGPIVLVAGLILGMYSRRYSPLSSTGWTGEKGQKGHKRSDSSSDPNTHHHKSLDEIVETLKVFTSRCNILLDPFLQLTDFLSTQRTATSATTRPALTTLFIRILLVTPIWILLTFAPLYIITTKRLVLTAGTIALSWHSRPARVSRAILWRSRTVRRVCATITGLQFAEVSVKGTTGDQTLPPPLPPRKSKGANEIAASLAAKRKPSAPGIRFTFSLYENQRRWLGIGWTGSMLAYERAAWTDEHLNSAPNKDQFELPEVEGGHARWRWVDGSKWYVEGASEEGDGETKGKPDDSGGWIFYDNKWRDPRRGRDGWNRWTRRRKWCRDAELVEITPSTEITPSPTPKPGLSASDNLAESQTLSEAETERPTSSHAPSDPPPEYTSVAGDADEQDITSTKSSSKKKKGWFGGRRTSRAGSEKSFNAPSFASSSSNYSQFDADEDDVHTPLRLKERESENAWGLGDDARMELG